MAKDQSIHIPTRMLLDSRIRYLRKSKNILMVDLANKAEISYKYLGEVGLGKNPTISVAKRIAAVLDLTLSELFDFSPNILRRDAGLRDRIIQLIQITHEDVR